MKTTFKKVAVVAGLVCLAFLLIGAVSNQFPLLRAYLQSNMDGNGNSITNLASIAATNFYGNGAGLTNVSGGGGGSTPTGTGVRKVVSGVENATASAIVNADVDAGAAIAVSKINGLGSIATLSSTPSGGDFSTAWPATVISALAVTDAKVAAANKDGTAGTPSMRTLGTGANQAAAGNDARITGALQAANNLSDAANAATARANLAVFATSSGNGTNGTFLGLATTNFNGSGMGHANGLLTDYQSAIAAGISPGDVQTNTTAAVTGSRIQNSPSREQYANAFVLSGSQTWPIGFGHQVVGVNGTLSASGYWNIYSSTNGSANTSIFTLDPLGNVTNKTVTGAQSRTGFGNTASIYVDPVLGSDTTGARGGLAFKTIAGACTVALAGDTITAAPAVTHAGATANLPIGVTLMAYGATVNALVNVTNNDFMLGGYYTISPHWNVSLAASSGTNFNYSQDLLVRGASGDGLIVDVADGLMRWNSCDFGSQWDAGLILDSHTNFTGEFFNCHWQSGGFSPWAAQVTDGFHGLCWTLGSGVNEGGRLLLSGCAITVLNSTNTPTGYQSATFYMNGNACFFIAAQGSGAGAPSFTGSASAELYNCVFNYGSTNVGVVTSGITNTFAGSIPIRGDYWDNPAAAYQASQNTSYTHRYLGTDAPSVFAGNVNLNSSANTASNQVFGANNLLTGILGDARYAPLAVTESLFSFTDITTANATTSQHGLLKKLDGNAAHYLGGDGNWTTPAGSGSQTPWTADEDAAGKNLNNVNTATITNSFRATQYAEFDGYGTNLFRVDPTNGVVLNTTLLANKNAFLAGSGNTASNEVFGANNILIGSLGDARYGLLSGTLAQFASTTSAQLAGVLSDETGTGAAVFAGSPTFTGLINGAAENLTGSMLAKQYTGTEPAGLGTTGTLNVDWSAGTHQSIGALTANVTLTFSNFATNTLGVMLGIYGDASHTVTWPTTEANGLVHWTGSTTTPPTQTVSKTDFYQLWRFNGTNYGAALQNFN